MFPRLQYLLLSDNQLFAWALPAAPLEGRPASLPTAWTRAKYPTAFPALLEMALYPGNDNICFIPSVSSDTLQIEGYREVNPGGPGVAGRMEHGRVDGGWRRNCTGGGVCGVCAGEGLSLVGRQPVHSNDPPKERRPHAICIRSLSHTASYRAA